MNGQAARNQNRLEYPLHLGLAASFLIAGVLLNPWTLAEFVSLDGFLAESTQKSIFIFEFVCLSAGGLLIFLRKNPILCSFSSKVLIAGTGVVGTLVIVEIATRIYFHIFPMPPKTLKEHRLSRPAPYQSAEYFNKRFIEEGFSLFRWTTPEGTRMLIPLDTAGAFHSVRNNHRHTTGQPESYANQVHVFGGSTVFCSEVPDEYTIPSRLQKRINRRGKRPLKVVNHGASGVTAAQQLEKLKTIDLQPGDIVIFYDGVNEILQSLYYGRPKGWAIGENQKTYKRINKKIYTLYKYFHEKSKFVDRFLYPFSTAVYPEHLKDESKVNSLLSEMRGLYKESIAEAFRYTTERRAHFLHLLQPQLFSDDHLTAYEKELVKNKHAVPNGTQYAFRKGYPVLKEVVEETAGKGIPSQDASDLFDRRPAGREYYLDFCHVNHEANQVVAEMLYKSLAGFI